MAQAKPNHIIIEINGDSFLCKDLKTAQALLTALSNAELQPLRTCWLNGIQSSSTLVKHGSFTACLNIGMSEWRNIDLEWKEPAKAEEEVEDDEPEDMPEIVNYEAMDEYPTAEHDSHNTE